MYIPVRPNTTYTLTGCGGPQNNTGAYLWDANKNFICRMVGLHQNKVVFTTTDQCYYVDLQLLSSEYGENQYDIDALQLEESPVATSYEPYFKETVDLYLDAPLRKVGDAADAVDWEKGKVIRRVVQAVLDGSTDEHYQCNNIPNVPHLFTCFNYGTTSYFGHIQHTFTQRDLGLCETYVLSVQPLAQSPDKSFRATDGIYFINQDVEESVEAWRAYLSEHPITCYLALAQPTETAVTLPALPFHPHRTHIFTVDTEVPGEIALAYHSFDHKEA